MREGNTGRTSHTILTGCSGRVRSRLAVQA